jgi:hypothetical protein
MMSDYIPLFLQSRGAKMESGFQKHKPQFTDIKPPSGLCHNRLLAVMRFVVYTVVVLRADSPGKAVQWFAESIPES